MNYEYSIIRRNTKLAEAIIKFFTAYGYDPTEFEIIKNICLNNDLKTNTIEEENLIKSGYLTKADLLAYLNKVKLINDTFDEGLINLIIRKLVTHFVIEPAPGSKTLEDFTKRFKANSERAMFACKNNLVMNMVCGWPYIADRYSDSVLKIVNIDSNGDQRIGTGFFSTASYEGQIRHMIITNKHVLEKANKMEIYTKNNLPIKYAGITLHPTLDLGVILLSKAISATPFLIGLSYHLLTDIITIGYPSVPMSADSYQLCHKGEINSFIQDYYKNDFLLFSAKTSSGNSGSPVIDSFGLVIGMVTQELFEKEEFKSQGKLPYYAAVPSQDILIGLTQMRIIDMPKALKHTI